MFYSKKLKKIGKIKHCFFSRKNGFSKGIYKGLNCGKGSKDKKRNIKRFADGEIYIEINENIRGNSVFVVQSTSNPAKLLLLNL